MLARGFKGQSYRDRSSGIGTSDNVVQAIEKAAAPFALKFMPLYGFAVFSLGVLNYLSSAPPLSSLVLL